MILLAVKYGLLLWGSCSNSDLFKSIERLHCRAARIIYNLPEDMALEDVLRYVQWPTFSIYYKLEVFRLFYRAHRESLPEIMYENVSQNRVSSYFIRDQNRLLVPRYESRYMKDSLSYRGASLWNFVNYKDKEASMTLNFNQFNFECTSTSTIRGRQQNFIYY